MWNSPRQLSTDVSAIIFRYIKGLKLRCKSLPHYFPNIVRYLMLIQSCGRPSLFILVERPYKTDIHPYIFSAMSYDPEKSGPTPSTEGLARMICASTGADKTEIEEWFRDSWLYLSSGVVLLNVLVDGDLNNARSHYQKVVFQVMMRDLLRRYLQEDGPKIHVVTMGQRVEETTKQILSSVGRGRSNIRVIIMCSPGVYMRCENDTKSQLLTVENRTALTLLLKHLIATKMSGSTAANEVDSLKGVADELVARLIAVKEQVDNPTLPPPVSMSDVLGDLIGVMQNLSIATTRASVGLRTLPVESRMGKSSVKGGTGRNSPFASSASVTSRTTATPIIPSLPPRKVSVQVFDDLDEDDLVSSPAPTTSSLSMPPSAPSAFRSISMKNPPVTPENKWGSTVSRGGSLPPSTAGSSIRSVSVAHMILDESDEEDNDGEITPSKTVLHSPCPPTKKSSLDFDTGPWVSLLCLLAGNFEEEGEEFASELTNAHAQNNFDDYQEDMLCTLHKFYRGNVTEAIASLSASITKETVDEDGFSSALGSFICALDVSDM